MSRCLVSGAAGFVGANLVRRLVSDGHEVTALVRPESDTWRLNGLPAGVRIVEADIRDAAATVNAVNGARPERVFHLAAWGGYSWQKDTDRIERTLITGTTNLLDASLAAGAGVFVNTGSSSEYGYRDHAPLESEVPAPNSHYAQGKAQATEYCRRAAAKAATRVMTLRPYSAYGPWEEPNRLVPTLIMKGLEGELPVLVDPEVARDFVWIGDLVDAYLLAAEKGPHEPGAVYNIATGIETKIRQAVEVARARLAIKVEPRWGSMENRGWDTTSWVGDASLARSVLGWEPKVPFAEGFSMTVDWFCASQGIREFYALRQAGT